MESCLLFDDWNYCLQNDRAVNFLHHDGSDDHHHGAVRDCRSKRRRQCCSRFFQRNSRHGASRHRKEINQLEAIMIHDIGKRMNPPETHAKVHHIYENRWAHFELTPCHGKKSQPGALLVSTANKLVAEFHQRILEFIWRGKNWIDHYAFLKTTTLMMNKLWKE